MCLGVYCLPGCVCTACLVLTGARRGHHIPWNWSYSVLGAAPRGLGTETESSGRKTMLLTMGNLSSPAHSFFPVVILPLK